MSTTNRKVTETEGRTQPFQNPSKNDPPSSNSIPDNPQPIPFSSSQLSVRCSLLTFFMIALPSIIVIFSPYYSNQSKALQSLPSTSRAFQSNLTPSPTPKPLQFEPTPFLIDTNHSIAYCTIYKNVCTKFRELMFWLINPRPQFKDARKTSHFFFFSGNPTLFFDVCPTKISSLARIFAFNNKEI